jgi:hypothetical protein
MNRKQLKELVKECLVELLSEGIGNISAESKKAVQTEVTRYPRPSLNNVSYGAVKDTTIKQTIKQVTKDPIMASIFEDTMQTTLQEQNAMDRQPGKMPAGVGGDAAARVMSQTDPTEMFGDEVASRWSEAAFAPSRRNQMSVSREFASEMLSMNNGIKKID